MRCEAGESRSHGEISKAPWTLQKTALALEPGDSYCRSVLVQALLVSQPSHRCVGTDGYFDQGNARPPGLALHLHACNATTCWETSEEALEEGLKIVSRTPEFYSGPGMTAIVAAELGESGLVDRMRDKALELDPEFSANQFVNWQWIKAPEHQSRMLDLLKSSGFPE